MTMTPCRASELSRETPAAPPSRRRSRAMISLLGAACLMMGASPVRAAPLDGFHVEMEAGPLAIIQNDGRYGSTGTPYLASTVNQSSNLLLGLRFSGEARFWERHRLILLYVPFDLTTRAQLNAPLTFKGVTFASGTPVESRYRFEGYRASYLYRVIEAGNWEADLGGSLQVRNALVAFNDLAGTQYVQEADIGLVPTLKARLTTRLASGATLSLDTDASSTFGAFGTPGGLLDTALTLGLPLTNRSETFLRVRYLGGGADVPSRQISNWGQFLSVVTGLKLTAF